ncbi:MAG: homocysteine S-methyltransferase family protein [Acidobacteria bacterium]|nr:homocysteine S-methyltransferase family protein [Acidobacteriota bacterium]
MTFEEMIAVSKVVLTEGGMVERIRRATLVALDPFIAHAGLIYDQQGRAALTQIYREYIDIARAVNLPMMSYAPTWRANPENLRKSVFAGYKNTNTDCVNFLKEIRESYADYSPSIFIGGLMACKGNAYSPVEALSKQDAAVFHREQAGELAISKVDFIKAATLPAISEAYGIAAAIAAQRIPYILSFVVRPDGTLLDGTPIYEAIEMIDSEIQPKPVFYMINCVHPGIFSQALRQECNSSRNVTDRILGFQANTSAKSPHELDNLSYLDTMPAEEFGSKMVALYKEFRIKVLGGCCGTDARHIKAIAKNLFP